MFSTSGSGALERARQIYTGELPCLDDQTKVDSILGSVNPNYRKKSTLTIIAPCGKEMPNVDSDIMVNFSKGFCTGCRLTILSGQIIIASRNGPECHESKRFEEEGKNSFTEFDI